MKILVIDDSQLHQQSARQTLGDHEITIVGTYDEAHELLQEPRVSQEAKYAEIRQRGIIGNPMTGATTEEERKAFWEEYARVETELRPPPPSFDIVLSDLLMPASRMTMGDKGMKYAGQEMPVGFALALMASLHGAKYVAVVTDTNHHDHPASAMLDDFSSQCPGRHPEGKPPRFVINGAKVGYYHSPMTLVEGTTCPDCDGTGKKGTGQKCWTCRNSGRQWGKDWGKVIAHLIANQ